MANDIKVAISLEGKDALRTMAALEKGVKTLGAVGTKSIGSMTGAMQVFQGVVGAQVFLKSIELTTRALKQGAKDALEFGSAIAEINSIAPRTAIETLALKEQLIGLSNEFAGPAQKQARAFYNIVSAGVQGTAKQLNTLEVANKAAVAGLVDIDTSARVLVSSVNSYAASGLTAQEASDILFNTVREGITTFGELSSSLGVVAPLASAAGLKFSELGGTLAFLTKSGISTAEATTGLRAILTGVIKPSEEAAKFAKQLGLEFNTSSIKSKGFSAFLKDVIDKTGGTETALAKLFPNVRALGPIIQVANGNFEDFTRILAETENSIGSTDKAFATITDSAAFQFEKLTNQLSNFPLSIATNFEAPLSDALKTVNQFVSTQGILLIADAVEAIIDAFQLFTKVSSEVDQFFNFLASGALELSKVMVSASSGIDQFFDFISVGALETSKAWNEFSLAARQAQLAIERFTGSDQVVELLEAEEQQLKKNIAAIEKSITAKQNQSVKTQQAEEDKIASIDAAILANQNATVALQVEEEKRLAISEQFRQKVAAGREAFAAQEEARKEQEIESDKVLAEQKLANALESEQVKFDAIAELKAANKELENEGLEEEKLAKELAGEEEFLFLQQNLGRQATIKELNRIKDIDDEKKRNAELKKLRKKAIKEEQGDILFIRKFEDLTNKEKIAGQRATLNSIATLQSSSSSALFAIGKAAALASAIVNTAQGVTLALASFPGPVGIAMGALVGVAGALSIAKIAATQKPASSAGSFQSGGIIEGTSQTGDQLTANVNGGEAIFNQRQQRNLFRAVDSGSLGNNGGGATTVNIQSLTGDIPQESIDNLIDQLNDRQEFGNRNLGVA